MAKNDYHEIVYYILKYLYACKKEGIKPREDILDLKEYPASICDEFKDFVYITTFEKGLISGIETMKIPVLGRGKIDIVKDMKNISITPEGIEYLSENSMMKKAHENLKMFKDLIPFI